MDDAYPTDGDLAALAAFTGTPREFAEHLIAAWSEYGTARIEHGFGAGGEDVVRVTLVTGGWSGNEEILSVAHRTTFWTLFWDSSNRGGRHCFEIPASVWDAADLIRPLGTPTDDVPAEHDRMVAERVALEALQAVGHTFHRSPDSEDDGRTCACLVLRELMRRYAA